MRSKISIIPGERLVLVLCSTFIFGMSFNLLKVARDCALTCTIPSTIVPFAFLLTSLFSLPVALFQTLETRYSKFRWFLGNLLLAGFVLLTFRVILLLFISGGNTYSSSGHALSTAVIYFVFFIFVSSYFSIVLSYNAFNTVYLAFPPKQREKPLIYAAVALMVGGLAGSYGSRYINPMMIEMVNKEYTAWLDPLIYAAVIVTLGIPVIIRFFRLDHIIHPAQEKASQTGLLTRIRWIWHESQLRQIGFYFITQGMVDTIGRCMLYLLIIQFTVMGTDGRTGLFSNLYSWLNIASLLVVAFGVERLFKSFGVKLSLFLIPAALLCAAFVLRFVPSIMVLLAWKVVEGTLSTAVQSPGQNQLLLTIGEDKTQLVRPLMQGFLVRAGEGLGALMVSIWLFTQGPDAIGLINLYIASLVMWFISIAALR
jgi:hypothetical protein